jgi:RHS repeat-associated protein
VLRPAFRLVAFVLGALLLAPTSSIAAPSATTLPQVPAESLPTLPSPAPPAEITPTCGAFCESAGIAPRTVSGNYHLDAWGNYRNPAELEASKNRFGFTGHLFDRETGTYYAKARYFDPGLGRFLTQDSYLGEIDNPPSLHRFLYANANPTTYVDPTGNASVEQWLFRDTVDGYGAALGKAVLYNTWNVLSFGTLARQDSLVEQSEAGLISEEQYWGRTAVNAGTAGAVVTATVLTGGAGAGAAQAFGAGARLAGAVGGTVGGMAGQATSDAIEIGLLGTKREIAGSDYALAAVTGGLFGAATGAVAARPAAGPRALTIGEGRVQLLGQRSGELAGDVASEAALAARRLTGTSPQPTNSTVGSGNVIGTLRDAFYGTRLRGIGRQATRDVDEAIAAGDINRLIGFGAGPNEAAGAVAGGQHFRGTIIDALGKNRATAAWDLSGLRATSRGRYGPDFWNPATRRSWDLTTPGQWGRHVRRYVTSPPRGRTGWRSIDPLFTRGQPVPAGGAGALGGTIGGLSGQAYEER